MVVWCVCPGHSRSAVQPLEVGFSPGRAANLGCVRLNNSVTCLAIGLRATTPQYRHVTPSMSMLTQQMLWLLCSNVHVYVPTLGAPVPVLKGRLNHIACVGYGFAQRGRYPGIVCCAVSMGSGAFVHSCSIALGLLLSDRVQLCCVPVDDAESVRLCSPLDTVHCKSGNRSATQTSLQAPPQRV